MAHSHVNEKSREFPFFTNLHAVERKSCRNPDPHPDPVCRTNNKASNPSTQPADLAAASTTEFHAGRISDSANQATNVATLIAKKHLRKCIPTLSKSTVNDFKSLNLHQVSSFLNLRHHMGRQLVGRVKARATSFAEANLTAAHRHKRIAVGPCQSEDRIVFVTVNV